MNSRDGHGVCIAQCIVYFSDLTQAGSMTLWQTEAYVAIYIIDFDYTHSASVVSIGSLQLVVKREISGKIGFFPTKITGSASTIHCCVSKWVRHIATRGIDGCDRAPTEACMVLKLVWYLMSRK